MGEEIKDTTANPETVVEKKDDSLLGNPNQEVKTEDKPVEGKESILDEAAKEAKQAQEVEDKRLLEAKEEDLSEEDKTKKADVLKKQEDAKAKEESDNKAKEVPEKYEFTVPEGMTLDQGLVDKVSPMFKEMGLSQEVAQKLVNVYADHQKDIHAAQEETFNKFKEDSKKETIKALGADYKQELAFAAKTRNGLLSAETVDLLNDSGLSNNINLIKDLISIGKLISEDKFVDGTKRPQGPKSASETLYPDQGKT